MKKLKKKANSSNEKEKVTIESLNVHCLLSIFEHLTMKEKLKVERVSTKWNRVSKLSWSQVKSLDVKKNNKEIFLSEISNDRNDKVMFTNFLISILNRSSKYLNKLSLEAHFIEKYFMIFQLGLWKEYYIMSN